MPRIKNPNNTVTGKCDNPDCDKEYKQQLSEFKRYKYHFCSKECRAKTVMRKRNLMWATCDSPDCDVHFLCLTSVAKHTTRRKFCSKACRSRTYLRESGQNLKNYYIAKMLKIPVNDLPADFIETKRTAILLKRQCGLYKRKSPNNPKPINQHG